MTHRARSWLFWLYLVAIVVGGVMVGRAVLDNRAAIRQSERALCSLRTDYAARSRHLHQILHANPDGTPDFTVAYINARLASYREDLAALSDINCPTKGTP